MSFKKPTLYFSEPGEANTSETLKAAKERADELGIRDIVVSSTTGRTGLEASKLFDGYNLVVVTHITGYKEPGVQELSDEIAGMIEANGGKILTATHALSGVTMAIQKKFDTMYPVGIIAQTLRLFGQGMKVAVEVAAMAVDAGLIRGNEDVVVVAGSHRGADTAVVIKTANARNLFDMVVKEIIAKPANL